MRFVSDLYNSQSLGLPVSGIGGIETWVDALHFLLLGATNLQVTTAVLRYGYRIVEDMIEGLTDYLIDRDISFLDELRNRGVKLFLASGTDAEYVIDEVNLLGLTPYFSEGIHGARDDYHSFSKKMLIYELYKTYNLEGPDMVSIGDGYVEIEDTKKRGGIAVGIASNEESGYGINEWKRNRLIQADADCIIPNFETGKDLLPVLFPSEKQVIK
jgi:phosphoglycolate phosphatase-like HAD superfamily hydrolase